MASFTTGVPPPPRWDPDDAAQLRQIKSAIRSALDAGAPPAGGAKAHPPPPAWEPTEEAEMLLISQVLRHWCARKLRTTFHSWLSRVRMRGSNACPTSHINQMAALDGPNHRVNTALLPEASVHRNGASSSDIYYLTP